MQAEKAIEQNPSGIDELVTAFDRRLFEAEIRFEAAKETLLSIPSDHVPLAAKRACLRTMENGLADLHEFRRELVEARL